MRLLHPVASQAFYSVWCGSDEDQPLSYIIRYHDEVACVGDCLGKHVPCENEVGKDKEYGSRCIQGAALNQCADQHAADQAGIDSGSDTYDAFRSGRDYLCEDEAQKCKSPDGHKQHIPFHLCREPVVSADLDLVSLDEEVYKPDMGNGEGSHLHD